MTDVTVPQENIATFVSEDSMHQYIRDIRKYPRLSAEEEQQLAKECAAGDQEAIRKMVVSNLQLVVSVAKEYNGRGVPLLDLIQEGSIGLIYAARKFDCSRNVRFSTYATKWISQGVARCVMHHNGIIRIPHYTAEKMYKVLRIKSQLLQQCKVYDYESGKYGDVYDMGKLDSRDLYDVFLSGSRSLLTIENPNAATDRELVVVRDSFGSSMVPLLVQDYAKVHVIDIRYVNLEVVDKFLDLSGQKDYLFLYSTLVLNNSNTIK